MSGAAQPAVGVGAGDEPDRADLARRLLNVVLFVTILTSAIAFIEPSPHDLLMFALFAMCIGARVAFDRKLVPLVALLTVWLVGACLSLLQLGDEAKAIQYVGTSIYLALAGVVFACLFSDGDGARLAVLRRSYILAALIATAAGYAGFFRLVPGYQIFLDNDRVSATFKDPNVYGPFLILPLLLLVSGTLTQGVKPLRVLATLFLLGGLFLSFSRGAWLHFAISAVTAGALLVATASDARTRSRILVLGLVAVIAVALLVVAMVSVDSVREMFIERAKAIQPYDVGPGGRFWEQRLALGVILDHPNGLGPFEFGRLFGTQQHDVYMQGFLVYGWLGGTAYLTLVAVTLGIGLRAALVSAPWQNYLIAAYAGFVGEACEGFIVDTDHWRHFFLLLGLVWGLTVATINNGRRQARYYALAPGLERHAAPAAGAA